jgi:hypothetical protein
MWAKIMCAHSEWRPGEAGLPAEAIEPPGSVGERLIRAVLLAGFVAVLATEAWLLWQVWS